MFLNPCSFTIGTIWFVMKSGNQLCCASKWNDRDLLQEAQRLHQRYNKVLICLRSGLDIISISLLYCTWHHNAHGLFSSLILVSYYPSRLELQIGLEADEAVWKTMLYSNLHTKTGSHTFHPAYKNIVYIWVCLQNRNKACERGQWDLYKNSHWLHLNQVCCNSFCILCIICLQCCLLKCVSVSKSALKVI